ncbi:MAG TPA: ATP-binding protein [Azospirillaceae bacterium]|nr:ATP-binding protein [Azospirillaceae bacterium]
MSTPNGADTGTWSPCLRAAADICRNAPFPALVMGADGTVVVNDACTDLGAHGTFWSPAADAFAQTFASGGPVTSRSLTWTTDEGRRWQARLHLTPVLEENGVSGVFAALALSGDATVEARRAVVDRSRFFAAASHDLRQPFQAMRLFLDSLLAQLPEGRSRQTAELLGKAMESGQVLLNALLDVSVLDAGTVKPKLMDIDLIEILDRLIKEFQPQAEGKGVALRARIKSCMVRTDPTLIERILRNLLANAVRYTPRGAVLVAVRHRGTKLRIEFWDTGFGIPEDELDTIFEEFRQLETPERDHNRGLGLGLAIVQKVAALLDTPLEVRSRVGRGSVFAVSVPLAKAVTPRPHDTTEAPYNLSGRTILVVDDDELVLTGLRMVLTSFGCEALTATGMAEALAKLDRLERDLDLILSDLRLRDGLSGLDVVARVREMFRRDIPAVILTGETAEARAVLTGHERGHWLVYKPLDPARLMAVLDEALDQTA